MVDYLVIKTAHISLVCASLSLFFLRAFWAINDRLQHKGLWVRRLPILIDTLLLSSGILLIYLSGFSPLHHHWLSIKLALLVLYIISGTVALKHNRVDIRLLFTFVALALIAAMMILAHFKPVLG